METESTATKLRISTRLPRTGRASCFHDDVRLCLTAHQTLSGERILQTQPQSPQGGAASTGVSSEWPTPSLLTTEEYLPFKIERMATEAD